nr:hypothetical protein [Tanacetum cinerariifolium]
EDHALAADVEAPTEFALMANTESKVKDGVGYNAVLPPAADLYLSPKKDLSWTVADAEAPTEFTLMANTESKVDGKLTGLLKASKNLDNLIESQRSDKVKDGVGYNDVPPAAADIYLSPKKDLSWTGPEFVLKKKACFSCGDFSHLANDCRKRVQRETTRSQNYVYMSPTHRSVSHRPHGAPMRPPHRSAGHRPHGSSMNPMRPNMNGARPNRSFFIQAHSYETRPFLKTSAVKTQYRAPWVPTVNRNNPPINRKFSTARRNFPTANRKFPTVSRKFPTGSTKIHTADMGRKGKAVKPS